MELRNEANINDVKEAVRLFKVSTLKSANSSSFNDSNSINMSSSYKNDLQKAERNIRRRVPIGTTISVKNLISEMLRRNISQTITRKCLDIMHGRNEITYVQRRTQVRRLR